MIPSRIGYYSSDFLYNSWRIFLLICALPSFLVGVFLIFFPESPKFLLMRCQNDEALRVFRHIYSSNTGKQPESYPVSLKKKNLKSGPSRSPTKSFLRFQVVDLLLSKVDGGKILKAEEASYVKMMLSDIVENSKQLFRTPILRFTLISITINFTFHIG